MSGGLRDDVADIVQAVGLGLEEGLRDIQQVHSLFCSYKKDSY